MAKVERKTQKIFGSQAGSKEITSFGTAKLDTPIYTTNLDEIQNTNFLNGWQGALLANKSPWEEDMNALFFAITKQLAYMFQEGIPEYDKDTTYYIGSMVKNVDNQGLLTVYKSVVNENTGNALNDTNYWSVYQTEVKTELELATYEIGTPQPTFSHKLLPNEVWLEGQELSRTAYANLFAIYGTTYGAGNGSTTFNVPDCRNRVLWGATSFGYIGAGLPNITGYFQGSNQGDTSLAFYKSGGTDAGADWKGGYKGIRINFNANLANPIYGASSTVQPPAIKCRVKTRYY